ncbi:hypothetical protein [Pseudobacteriovorax antillogorgiicola]|uniref:Uncharacterized protein n=1 Tax=Pseudobacteriovorax antillogorgiicola TaxID=1513793 RepID=A0A1Y6CCW3_9BACT|nr:hypothetical protein [Pseudobacteriovorax antillogorgiicola]TCS48234.1 hypothetical protein EDD56_11814 [Pseudobacteriovorax antillogorgiicola]SMF57309.1 hypothetical protein SAMN06296036_118127 [Pseudobacteriovorax antillogorgiicola]
MESPDFSKQSTDKAVLAETLQHPLTLGFATIGIFGGAASALFSLGTLPALVGVGGASLAALSWIVNYMFRKEIFAARHIQKLQTMLDEHRRETVRKIETQLKELEGEPGLTTYCQQGAEQFHRSKQRYENLAQILRSKLSTSELTYSRYLGTAEQVYMAVLDNLLQVVHSLQSIKPIDSVYMNERLKILNEIEPKTDADLKEVNTLEDRKNLRDQQIELINQILTNNEEAMTMLDRTAASIALMRAGVSQTEQGLDDAMKDLEDLAKRTTRY